MVTLAHLSDPHLAPLPQPHWTQLIGKRITGYINWRRKRHLIHDPKTLARIVVDMKTHSPDHIAVTGDIANLALPEEFPRGRDWLESLGSPHDVSFVPGNHDIYVAAGGALAARQWGAFMAADDGSAGFPYVRRRGPLGLVGVNSGVPTAPFLATGWLGAKQLAELAAALKRLKDENLFRVVMIHHPPVSHAGRHKRLLDADIFKRVIAAHGAELVIHGHDHLNMIEPLTGPDGTQVPAVGVASASAAPGTSKTDASYNLYRIGGATGAWTCELETRGMTRDGEVVTLGKTVLVG
ncbi:MAG: metallophosphoesterase [Xanthobacteraceae bacterium]|uniref:metallophosphoesterase family protein n=1 Tax=Pseudolabrys sp. TaxID=1960880 RepID=UPI003D151BDE